MVVRDRHGVFITSRSTFHEGLYTAWEAEAVGLLEALSWSLALGFENVLFELDAKNVVAAVNSSLEDISEFGSIILRSRKLFSMDSSYKVVFARRLANMVAHTLAKTSCSYANPLDFYEVSHIISELLEDDVLDVFIN
ncbi:hypothetical protein DITRI_Ditri19aG0105500 [Diplodiscus trichospermus]